MAEQKKGFLGYGYENAQGDRVVSLRDMIDGGGKGRSGDKFEGGGILSLIANMVATPYGSQRERKFGLIPGEKSPQAPAQSFRPMQRPAAAEVTPPTAAELLAGDQAAYDAAFGGQTPAEYDPSIIKDLPSAIFMGGPMSPSGGFSPEGANADALQQILSDPRIPDVAKQEMVGQLLGR